MSFTKHRILDRRGRRKGPDVLLLTDGMCIVLDSEEKHHVFCWRVHIKRSDDLQCNLQNI